MARQIVVELDGIESSFDFAKLDRSKLYGTRKRVALDPDGQPCERADLTSDGAVLLRRGMTAQGYFDEAGFQCAFCAPGFIMSMVALVNDNPNCTREQARDALAGNLCRCADYKKILDSAMRAAEYTRRAGAGRA